MTLLPLSKHCSAISNILMEIENDHDWIGVHDWLLVASSIMSIKVDTIQHNPNFGWCCHGDEFDEAREVLLEKFVKSLTIFGFAWGALEAVIDAICPPPHPDKSKRGKIGNACNFLKQAFHTRGYVLGLEEEIDNFRSLARQCIGYESVEKRLKNAGSVGVPGIGLYTVYELRNLFAHGSLAFPFPNEDNRPISEHSDMVAHATRIVLLQLQMLLLAHFGESEEPITVLEAAHPFPWSTGTTLWKALRSCHLEIAEDPRQLSLFDTNIQG
ncbi:TPA: hypothetical protein SL281_000147 [Pseudomonas aeruginosa]|uniref:hypothetical protein n=3 Tax=Pseudomonas aeruginosa TaxID=287 RepID=UPI001ED9A5EB|nr:hypothetical protein [Pseudomonas aeruginosa]HBO2452828.1 hypothetical protein [Pseudomonas aeruginosa]HCK4684072.1 hypothetical protein [Pseudomonas aeruginosa]HEJ3036924.1 hypothetical protein [Pseudomonas aeruginosa]